MKPHSGGDAPPGTDATVDAPSTATSRGVGTRVIACLFLLAILDNAAAHSASPSRPPARGVVSFRVYRAIDSRLLGGSLGDAGTLLGNTDAASAGGVLAYLHTEVVPTFGRRATGRRLNDIDAIAVFDVHVLNVERARQSPSSDPPGSVKLFGPYMAFEAGAAMPLQARDQIASLGAYVGVQDQAHHPRHAYPGNWYSFVGGCPFSRWNSYEGGGHHKPAPCPSKPALDGICPASTSRPDGTPLCQYTYEYRGYVRLDDLVGITSKADPLCREGGKPRACIDYADFEQNGGVEYSTGPRSTMDCAGGSLAESGLPFWRGRCDPEKARARIHALTSAALIVPDSSATTGSERSGGR